MIESFLKYLQYEKRLSPHTTLAYKNDLHQFQTFLNTNYPDEAIEQADLDQFPPGAEGAECTTCMYWWNEGITAELPELTN